MNGVATRLLLSRGWLRLSMMSLNEGVPTLPPGYIDESQFRNSHTIDTLEFSSVVKA
jgi:hypothetical protein